MFLYDSNHLAKQSIKGKPIKFGYKIWCLNISHGYLAQCNLYVSKRNHNLKLELAGSVVSSLVTTLPELHWNITFDTLFTYLNIFHYLSKHDVVGTGTLRVNPKNA